MLRARAGSLLSVKACALLMVLAGVGFSADEAAGPAPADISKWIEQLNAERFTDRQEASQKLAEIGKPAIAPLAKAAVGDSLEVTIRSIEILKKFYQSSDESLKAAAKEALEQIASSGKAAAARRAKEVLAPKEQPQADPNAPGQGIIIGNIPAGGIIQGRIQIGAGGKKISIKNVGGVKEIEAEEDGKKVRIVEDPQKGIKLEITEKNKEGKEETKTYEAKNAEELEKKHPEAYKVYKEYSQGQVGGIAQIQIAPNIVPIPVQPVPAQAAQARARASVDLANVMARSLLARLKEANSDEAIRNATPESKDQLRKSLEELKKEIAEMEKRLQEDAKKPAEATPKKEDAPKATDSENSTDEKPADKPAVQAVPRPVGERLRPMIELH
jgi:hypothetical protein